jgi:hypothetical protein
MPTGRDDVRLQGETGSSRPTTKMTRLPEPTLDFASHNTKKRHSRAARGGMAEVVTTMHHRGKAQIIDGTGSLEAVRERTPQPSPIPQRPPTVMTAHTLQSVHPEADPAV